MKSSLKEAPSKSDTYDMLPTAIRLTYVMLVLLLLGLMIFSFPLGLYIIFNTNVGRSSTNLIKTLFVFLWFIYLAIFIMAMRGPRLKLHRFPRIALRDGLKVIFDNTLSTIAVNFSALLLIIVFISLLQEGVGIPTGSLPETNPILDFLSDSLAPLLEEFIFRIFAIGTATVIILMVRGASFNFFKALWRPSEYTPKMRKADMRLLYLVVFISGLLFGYAHVALGGGWEIGKVTTSSLVGIIFGLVYLFYGLPGAVLLHWSFNYFTGSYYYFEKVVGESSLLYFADWSVIIVGLASILFLLIHALGRIIKIHSRKEFLKEEGI
ncbi:MAG: CPBP family glutamic-type intramembrane protease [Candidatus Methylarchaceae archaeon HK01M]|nr:CPBP family glutamic-type intramembrane protease [Candidatus Methylarchaceae archaeon HK01M]